jgi:hypothetical protein
VRRQNLLGFVQPKPAGVNHPSQPDIFGDWPLTTEQMTFEQMTTEQMTTEQVTSDPDQLTSRSTKYLIQQLRQPESRFRQLLPDHFTI